MRLEIITYKSKIDSKSPPILFVHGAWHGAWCWEEHFLPYFAKYGYSAYALSLQGHGGSCSNKKLYKVSIDDYLHNIVHAITVLSESEYTPPILVGHSMGAMILQKYLKTENVPSILAAVLLTPVPIKGIRTTALRIFRKNPCIFIHCLLKLSVFPVIGTPQLAKKAFFSSDISDTIFNKYYAQMQDESIRVFFEMMFPKLSSHKKIMCLY